MPTSPKSKNTSSPNFKNDLLKKINDIGFVDAGWRTFKIIFEDNLKVDGEKAFGSANFDRDWETYIIYFFE